MTEPKVIIFDFDGTLADVVEVIKQIYEEESQKRGWPKLSENQYKKLRKGTIKQAMAWAGVRSWQLPGLLRQGRKSFYAKSKNVKLFPGITELIKKLYLDGWEIYVLSANSDKTIHEIMRRNDADQYVHVLKRSPLFGKASAIRKLMKKHRYQRENVWMVGDEVRDLEAAKKVGVKSIAVSWGLQDESLLKVNQPNAVANKPKDIINILKKGQS
jgi:phosphoglycolate phosphatase